MKIFKFLMALFLFISAPILFIATDVSHPSDLLYTWPGTSNVGWNDKYDYVGWWIIYIMSVLLNIIWTILCIWSSWSIFKMTDKEFEECITPKI